MSINMSTFVSKSPQFRRDQLAFHSKSKSKSPLPVRTTRDNKTTPQNKDDVFKDINDFFTSSYSVAKNINVKAHQKAVIICDGAFVSFYKDGKRVDRAPIRDDKYEGYKSISHLPLTIYVIFLNYIAGKIDFPKKEVQELISKTKKIELQQLVDRFHEPAKIKINLHVVSQSLKFLESALKNETVTKVELLAFCRDMVPAIKENLMSAVTSTVELCHKEVCKFKATLTEESWNDVRVMLMGPHMPRKGNTHTQYFSRLLNVPEEEDHKLIYCEGTEDEEAAMDILATNVTDTEAGCAFFGDPDTLHSDVLSVAARAYLDKVFKQSSASVGIVQLYTIIGDDFGNLLRARNALVGSVQVPDLICLPEGLVTETHLEKLTQMAEEFKAYVACGMLTCDSSHLILVDPTGQVILDVSETTGPLCCDTRVGKVSLLNKWPLSQEEADSIKNQNPDLVIMPIGISFPREGDQNGLLGVARAISSRFECAVIIVNSVSERSTIHFSELIEESVSVIVDKNGHILAKGIPCDFSFEIATILQAPLLSPIDQSDGYCPHLINSH